MSRIACLGLCGRCWPPTSLAWAADQVPQFLASRMPAADSQVAAARPLDAPAKTFSGKPTCRAGLVVAHRLEAIASIVTTCVNTGKDRGAAQRLVPRGRRRQQVSQAQGQAPVEGLIALDLNTRQGRVGATAHTRPFRPSRTTSRTRWPPKHPRPTASGSMPTSATWAVLLRHGRHAAVVEAAAAVAETSTAGAPPRRPSCTTIASVPGERQRRKVVLAGARQEDGRGNDAHRPRGKDQLRHAVRLAERRSAPSWSPPASATPAATISTATCCGRSRASRSWPFPRRSRSTATCI